VKPATVSQLLPWLLPLGLLAVWQSLSSAGVLSVRILPSPVAVLVAGIHLTQTGELPLHLFESFRRASTGLLIGGSLGFLLGLVNGVSRLADKLFDSSVQMVRNIPHLAMIPLVILWFGIGEQAKLFLITIGVFFPIYINTVNRNGAELWAWPLRTVLECDPAGCAAIDPGGSAVRSWHYVADADSGGNHRV
jgi:sulfonate transport system permease protein